MERWGGLQWGVFQQPAKLLKIAYITEDQRKKVDSIHKYSMPENWNWKTDSILERLVIAGVEVVNPKNSCEFVE